MRPLTKVALAISAGALVWTLGALVVPDSRPSLIGSVFSVGLAGGLWGYILAEDKFRSVRPVLAVGLAFAMLSSGATLLLVSMLRHLLVG